MRVLFVIIITLAAYAVTAIVTEGTAVTVMESGVGARQALLDSF